LFEGVDRFGTRVPQRRLGTASLIARDMGIIGIYFWLQAREKLRAPKYHGTYRSPNDLCNPEVES